MDFALRTNYLKMAKQYVLMIRLTTLAIIILALGVIYLLTNAGEVDYIGLLYMGLLYVQLKVQDSSLTRLYNDAIADQHKIKKDYIRARELTWQLEKSTDLENEEQVKGLNEIKEADSKFFAFLKHLHKDQAATEKYIKRYRDNMLYKKIIKLK